MRTDSPPLLHVQQNGWDQRAAATKRHVRTVKGDIQLQDWLVLIKIIIIIKKYVILHRRFLDV